MSQEEEKRSEFEGLSKQKLVEMLEKLQKDLHLSPVQISKLIQGENSQKEMFIPITIFRKEIAGLECIVKYLKEELQRTFHEIAELLQRDDRTIWATYRNAQQKYPQRLKAKKTSFSFPLRIIQNRALSVLENIVAYLKEECALTYHQIAVQIQRDERTVWTVYARAKRKRKA